MNWYADVFRKMHFDMHTPGNVENVAVEFDAELLAERLDRIGVEAICWFAKCGYGWSYYPTKIGRRHPHLQADIFPLAVEACHRRGIRVLGYYHLTGCEWATEDHPEWFNRKADESIEDHGGSIRALCPMSPAGDDLIIPHLVEVVTMQPADGLFIDDLVGWTTCYCAACRKAYGAAPPCSASDAGWDEYLAWRREAASAFFERAAAAVHAARPDALFGINYAGSFRHPDVLPPGIDYLTADVAEPESSSLNASLLLRQFARQALPFDAMNSRMLHWWTDWTQKPVTAMKQEFATILANGGRTFLGDISYHRTAMPDPAVLTNAGEAFALAREIEPYVRGAQPVPDLAILNSAQSHYRQTHSPNADPIPVKGAHLALLEAGLYAHVLPEEDLARLLPDYRGLVVPEQQHLAEESLAAIRAFVEQGGGLVVIGDTQLAEVLGVERVGLSEGDRNYFVCTEEDLNPEDEVACPPRLVHGKAVLTRAVTAEVIAPHIAGLPGGAPHSGPPPGAESGHPAITINRTKIGTEPFSGPSLVPGMDPKRAPSHFRPPGKAAFVALPIATDFFARGHAALAPVMAGLVRRVCEPRLEVESDAPIEATLLQRDDALFIHLVNTTASRYPGRPAIVDRIARASDVTVRLRLDREPEVVEGIPEPVRWRFAEGVLEAVVPEVGLWACIEVHRP